MKDLSQYKQLVYNIIGSAMNVHNELNFGLLEDVYKEALHIELALHDIPSVMEQKIDVFYKGVRLKKMYRMDLVVGDIVCELKVAKNICPEHRSQLCNYLRLTHKPIGLLINFGGGSLDGERWAYDETTNECYLIDVNMMPVHGVNVEFDYEYSESLTDDSSEYLVLPKN